MEDSQSSSLPKIRIRNEKKKFLKNVAHHENIHLPVINPEKRLSQKKVDKSKNSVKKKEDDMLFIKQVKDKYKEDKKQIKNDIKEREKSIKEYLLECEKLKSKTEKRTFENDQYMLIQLIIEEQMMIIDELRHQFRFMNKNFDVILKFTIWNKNKYLYDEEIEKSKHPLAKKMKKINPKFDEMWEVEETRKIRVKVYEKMIDRILIEMDENELNAKTEEKMMKEIYNSMKLEDEFDKYYELKKREFETKLNIDKEKYYITLKYKGFGKYICKKYRKKKSKRKVKEPKISINDSSNNEKHHTKVMNDSKHINEKTKNVKKKEVKNVTIDDMSNMSMVKLVDINKRGSFSDVIDYKMDFGRKKKDVKIEKKRNWKRSNGNKSIEKDKHEKKKMKNNKSDKLVPSKSLKLGIKKSKRLRRKIKSSTNLEMEIEEGLDSIKKGKRRKRRIKLTKTKVKEHTSTNNEFNSIPKEFILKVEDTKVLEVIHRSKKSEVLKCVWRGQIVAMKNVKSTKYSIENVIHELKVCKTLISPNILKIYGIIDGGGDEKIYVEEFCSYGTIDSFLKCVRKRKRREGLFFKDKIRLIKDLVCTLKMLEDNSISHRDVRISNILIDDDMNLKLKNFKHARTIGMKRSDDKDIIDKVKDVYIPPEASNNNEEIYSRKYDVYSFAFVAFYIIEEVDPVDVWKDLKDDERPKFDKKKWNFNESLINLISRCWIKDPTSRPSFFSINKVIDDVLSIPIMHKMAFFVCNEKYNNYDDLKGSISHTDEIESVFEKSGYEIFSCKNLKYENLINEFNIFYQKRNDFLVRNNKEDLVCVLYFNGYGLIESKEKCSFYSVDVNYNRKPCRKRELTLKYITNCFANSERVKNVIVFDVKMLKCDNSKDGEHNNKEKNKRRNGFRGFKRKKKEEKLKNDDAKKKSRDLLNYLLFYSQQPSTFSSLETIHNNQFAYSIKTRLEDAQNNIDLLEIFEDITLLTKKLTNSIQIPSCELINLNSSILWITSKSFNSNYDYIVMKRKKNCFSVDSFTYENEKCWFVFEKTQLKVKSEDINKCVEYKNIISISSAYFVKRVFIFIKENNVDLRHTFSFSKNSSFDISNFLHLVKKNVFIYAKKCKKLIIGEDKLVKNKIISLKNDWKVVKHLNKRFDFGISWSAVKDVKTIGYNDKSCVLYYRGRWKSKKKNVFIKKFVLNEFEFNYKLQKIKFELKRIVKVCESSDHPQISSFYGVSFFKNNFCFMFEFCEFGNLNQYNNNKKALNPIPFLEKIRIFIDLCNGLKYIHSKNIVHASIRPKNVLLDTKLCVKLKGFEEINPKKSLFMSIEAIVRNEYTDKSDIYSFGMLIHHILINKTCVKAVFEDVKTIQRIVNDPNFNIININEKETIDCYQKNKQLLLLVTDCLKRDKNERPSLKSVENILFDIKSNHARTRKVALIVSNSNYKNLKNECNCYRKNGKKMNNLFKNSKKFEFIRFFEDVVDKNDFEKKVESFCEKRERIRNENPYCEVQTVVYFSGMGMKCVFRQNNEVEDFFLYPVEINQNSDKEIVKNSFSLKEMKRLLNKFNPKYKKDGERIMFRTKDIFILDCTCKNADNNVQKKDNCTSVDRNHPKSVDDNSIVCFCFSNLDQKGVKQVDNDDSIDEKNTCSVYNESLLKYLKSENGDFEDIMKSVKKRVFEVTDGLQNPSLESKLTSPLMWELLTKDKDNVKK